MIIRLVSRRQPQPPAFRVASSAPRRDGTACGGLERRGRRGRAADLCGGQGGHGPQRRLWPRKGFKLLWEWLWRGDGRGKGVRTWAGDFRALLWDVGSYLLLKIHFCAGMGLLQFGYNIRNDQTWRGKDMSGSRRTYAFGFGSWCQFNFKLKLRFTKHFIGCCGF